MQRVLGIAILVLDIVAIIDCLKSNLSAGKKALWVILILLVPLVGMILYFAVGRK